MAEMGNAASPEENLSAWEVESEITCALMEVVTERFGALEVAVVEVITLHRKGNGYKKIAKMLNIPRETIGSIIRKFKAKGTVETLPGRSRKKMLTLTAVRYLKRRVEKSPRVTAEELRKDLSDVGTEVSAQTIRRTLRNEGLHARTPRRTPLLSPKNKKSRLQYAKSHVDKPQKFWDSVLWTDETKLDLFGPMDQRYVWRRKNKAYEEKNTLPTVKHGGGVNHALGLFCFCRYREASACARYHEFSSVPGDIG
uniref:Transposase Tc1-like domain-containing protein n=1 Tax=Leptobrachium leishanense TaxID=445787 RepID=A0A8C5MHI1_9ANUR